MAMVASELDSAMMPLNNDDGECTITDLAAGEDGPGEIAVESIDEDGVEETQPEETLLEQAIKEAVALLKEIKKLKTSVEVRAALPAAAFLGEKMVWVTKRVRALAVKCGFDPPLGMTRMVLLKMIEDFRLGLEGGVLGDELLQGDAPPAPVVLDDEDGEDEVELARLRELEEAELLFLIEESERENVWRPNLRLRRNVRLKVMPCPRAMPRGWCPCGHNLASRGGRTRASAPSPAPRPSPSPSAFPS
jgi:hypothetical protein